MLIGKETDEHSDAFIVNKELLQQYGPDRIIALPFSESGLLGAGIGAALAGLRPVVEIGTLKEDRQATWQLIHCIATLLQKPGHTRHVPLIIIISCSSEQSMTGCDTLFTGIPGLTLLSVGVHEDARCMLLKSLQLSRPAIIFNYPSMLTLEKNIAMNAADMEINMPVIRKEGRDISIVTYGTGVYKALDAAEELTDFDIDAEVVDLRVLRPLNISSVVDSVRKTNLLLLVEDTWGVLNIAAEVSLLVTDQAFYDLDAPSQRLCEEAVRTEVIVNKVREMLSHKN